jgi:hypothetical protein
MSGYGKHKLVHWTWAFIWAALAGIAVLWSAWPAWARIGLAIGLGIVVPSWDDLIISREAFRQRYEELERLNKADG